MALRKPRYPQDLHPTSYARAHQHSDSSWGTTLTPSKNPPLIVHPVAPVISQVSPVTSTTVSRSLTPFPPTDKKGKEAWGPAGWTFIHSAAAAYKPEKAKQFRAFIESLVHVLPCDVCGKNHQEHLSRLDDLNAYMNSRDDFFYLTYLLHDMVNREHGKQSPPYEVVKSWYIKMTDECPSCGKK